MAMTVLAAGCGGDDDAGDRAARADRPVDPPRGWRTVKNGQAGFTIAAPRRWTARTRKGATVIRSDDRLVVMTLAADRGREGKQARPASYARRALESLPEFEGGVSAQARRVRGSPYDSARVEGIGTLRTARRPQRITVAAFTRRGRATYAAVVFRNPRATPRFDERAVDRMLRTLRG